jgi:hypothetical protein
MTDDQSSFELGPIAAFAALNLSEFSSQFPTTAVQIIKNGSSLLFNGNLRRSIRRVFFYPWGGISQGRKPARPVRLSGHGAAKQAIS